MNDSLSTFKRSWVHKTGLQLLTLSVLTASFSLIFCLRLISQNFNSAIKNTDTNLQITAYLSEGISQRDVEQIVKNIQTIKSIQKVEYINSEKATENFKQSIAKYAPNLVDQELKDDTFPASLKLSIDGSLIGEKINFIEEIALKVKNFAGIEEVNYGQNWVKNYSSVIRIFSQIGLIFMFVIAVSSVFIISNMIRASMMSRFDEIALLELFGATNSMIRKPLVIEGTLMGLVAGILALTLNFVFLLIFKEMISESLWLNRFATGLHFLQISDVLLCLTFATLIGAISSRITVAKLNSGWLASQNAHQ